MPTNFPSGVKSRGVPVEGLGGIGSPLLTTGNVYHVDSGADAADNDNAATNPKQPAATLDGAIGKCTANNGDVILVAPGHSETISAAAAITFDVAGITVIGMGVGNSRPTITLDTATSTDIDVTAADVQIHNMIFSMNYADIVEVFDLSGRLLQTTNSTTISLKDYAKGIYVFRVAYGDRVEELKVVKD